jgi:putative redox protein
MIQAHRREALTIEIQARAHQLLADVAPALGGKDLAPSPHELLEAALGACTSITVQMYANRKSWKLTSCDTTVKFIQEDQNGIVIERVLDLQGELDEAQRARLFEIAEKCPIHQVIVRGAQVQTRLKT